MASNEVTVKLDVKDLIAELEAARELLSKERIQQIVREEIEAWMKDASKALSARGSVYEPMPAIKYLNMETK
jgi:hypothetical protein